MSQALPFVHVAGLLVAAHPAELAGVARQLAARPDTEVHAADEAAGRLVVTVETASVDGQETAFREISALPGVAVVSLVCHRAEPADEATGDLT
jgi:nitrate reductase NapAB chaperone NapD